MKYQRYLSFTRSALATGEKELLIMIWLYRSKEMERDFTRRDYIALLSIIVLLSIPVGLSTTFFVLDLRDYGSLLKVSARVIHHYILSDGYTFNGILTVCDRQENYGNLTIISSWDQSLEELDGYLNENYPINSTLFCYHYAKRPEVYQTSAVANWTISLAFMIGSGFLFLGVGIFFMIIICRSTKRHSYQKVS